MDRLPGICAGNGPTLSPNCPPRSQNKTKQKKTHACSTEHGMVLHGIERYCMILHGIVWYCMALHGIEWYYKLLKSQRNNVPHAV